MKTIWKDIVGYEGIYTISNKGQIKNKHGRLLKQQLKIGRYHKYFSISLYDINMGKKYFNISQLMAIAFLGHTTENRKIVVDHINNIPTDNRLENLQIITNRENSSKDKKGYSSKYVGVDYIKRSGKWRSRILIDGISHHLGCFVNEFNAHLSYQNKLNQLISV